MRDDSRDNEHEGRHGSGRREGDRDDFFELLYRTLQVVYVPILAWMLLTILEHDRSLASMQASRFTASQAAELTVTLTRALTELQGITTSLQFQMDNLSQDHREFNERLRRQP
jgi:hypothetical protein